MSILTRSPFLSTTPLASHFAVTNPATSQVLYHVLDSPASSLPQLVTQASTAQKQWAATTATHRSSLLKKWHALILQHADELATIMTQENGKPLKESKGEIAYGAGYIEWFAEEAKRTYGEIIPEPVEGRKLLVIKQPVGVVAMITPWNFPCAMLTRKIAPALAAGCTCLVKPAAETPLSALALAVLASEAGIPEGVINMVPTQKHIKEVGAFLTSSPIIRKISFTGSTAVGKLLMEQSSKTLKRMSLELGGNAPFIVFDDANLKAAVIGAMQSKFRNTGQTCVCTNRFYVQAGIYEKFIEALTEEVKKLRVGNGLEGDTDQGPLITSNAVDKVEKHISDAVSKGARVVIGGKKHALGRTYFEPTILADMKPNMLISEEETFGPVAAIYSFNDEAEVLKLANDTPFGLASYFFSSNMARCWRVSGALETGMVGVNVGLISTEVAPFGGIKESGMGREGGRSGIDDYMQQKYIAMSTQE